MKRGRQRKGRREGGRREGGREGEREGRNDGGMVKEKERVREMEGEGWSEEEGKG